MSETDSWKPVNTVQENSRRIGLEIETAVAHDNLQDYRQAMSHATDFIKANPDQRDVIHYEVLAQFGRDNATSAVTDFALVHAEHGDSSTITKDQITDAKSKAANSIERDLLGTSEALYDQLPAWFWSTSFSNASISKIESRLGTEQQNLLPGNDIRNFFQRDDQGMSLYDRVKDSSDNIRYGAIASLQDSNLSAKQKSVLSSMDQYQSNKYWLFGDRGMSGQDLKKVVIDNHMNFDVLTGKQKSNEATQRPWD